MYIYIYMCHGNFTIFLPDYSLIGIELITGYIYNLKPLMAVTRILLVSNKRGKITLKRWNQGNCLVIPIYDEGSKSELQKPLHNSTKLSIYLSSLIFPTYTFQEHYTSAKKATKIGHGETKEDFPFSNFLIWYLLYL